MPDRRLTRLAAPSGADAVALWSGDLRPRDGDVDLALLSDVDRDRLATLPQAGATLLLARRALLGMVSALHLGGEPHQLSWVDGPGPRAVEHPSGRRLHVSVSVSRDRCLIAVCEHPVGVDVELLALVPEALDIAALMLSPQECSWVQEATGSGPAAVSERFLAVWVRKEAVVKCTGTGLTGCDPRAFTVDASRESAAVVETGAGGDMRTIAIPLAGAVAALAMTTTGAQSGPLRPPP